MKLILALFLSVFSLSTFAYESEFSGNIEGQVRNSNNNESAKKDLFQDWNNENFYLLYGNLNYKMDFENSRIETNWFGRYTKSDLFQPRPYIATQIFTFPNQLVARDLFKLQHKDQSGDHQTESILNKLYYEKDIGNHRLMLGRMYVNYGLGEVFNPINPFNQPTGLTSISQVAQGNDGASFTYFLNDRHTLQFLALGDKRLENYEGHISKTLWAHGEYQASEELQLDYTLGEDQERYKFGGQISYQFAQAMVFSQAFYQTENLKNTPSTELFDLLLGYDQQLTNKWHLRFEGGFQKQDTFANPNNFVRFLPIKYFTALANVYEIHPLVKLTGTLVTDLESGFNYGIAKATYNFRENLEAEIFGFSPLAKGGSTSNVAQKLVTSDVGLAVRAFF